MVENEKAQSSEMQTKEERNTPLKPDGILTKKMNGKTFVTEIYFDPNTHQPLINCASKYQSSISIINQTMAIPTI